MVPVQVSEISTFLINDRGANYKNILQYLLYLYMCSAVAYSSLHVQITRVQSVQYGVYVDSICSCVHIHIPLGTGWILGLSRAD